MSDRKFQFGRLDPVHGDLGNVDEAFDPVGDRDERTERHRLDDFALDDRADLVLPGEDLPIFHAG